MQKHLKLLVRKFVDCVELRRCGVIVEIYRRESSVVGRVLGETRKKYQATTKGS